ncbi:hypothetical protein FB45DRAFT_1059693 [Roridomyces roridus]|uniref:Uncharacterized protein n=1 Tax=Roridomyces roridus TaxID=1738132 RepID=A0AAD7FMV9_9AGAR|nr:hypothetical protein FB45DRAFT_1059693 [Roridomyces roridus]
MIHLVPWLSSCRYESMSQISLARDTPPRRLPSGQSATFSVAAHRATSDNSIHWNCCSRPRSCYAAGAMLLLQQSKLRDLIQQRIRPKSTLISFGWRHITEQDRSLFALRTSDSEASHFSLPATPWLRSSRLLQRGMFSPHITESRIKIRPGTSWRRGIQHLESGTNAGPADSRPSLSKRMHGLRLRRHSESISSKMRSLFLVMLVIATLPAGAAAQQIQINAPTAANPARQCEPFNITWTGGTPPYTLAAFPVVNDTKTVVPIADSVNGTSQIWIVPFNAGESVQLGVADANGHQNGSASFFVAPGSGVPCLMVNASTSQSLSRTSIISSQTPFPSNSSTTALIASKRTSAAGPILGGVLGGAVAVLLIWWCIRRHLRLRSPIPPLDAEQIGEIRSASTLALDRPSPPALIESQAAMLEKLNAFVTALPAPESLSSGSSSSNRATETQLLAVVERVALLEAALTARGEALPPNYIVIDVWTGAHRGSDEMGGISDYVHMLANNFSY